MFLVPSFSTLCSLLALLGTVGAQSPSLPYGPPASSVVSSSLSTRPSSTSLGSSLTSPSVSSATSPVLPVTTGFSKIGNVLKPAITSYTFNPFPIPLESSIPKVFPETYPDNPPPVGDSAIPNFGPAWAAAHGKARARVSRFLMPPRPLPFKHSCVGSIVTGSGFDARRESQYHHWCWLDEGSVCWKHPASSGFPWSLFGGTFALSHRARFLRILRVLVGLSARSAIRRLCHRVPCWDKYRRDVSFRS